MMNLSNNSDQFVSNFSSSFPPYPLPTVITVYILTLMGIFVNILVVTVIWKSKKLRSPCFTLIAGAAIGSMLEAFGNLGVTIGKTGGRNGVWSNVNYSRGICLIMSFWAFDIPVVIFNSQAATLVALDRTLGSLAPFTYQQLGKRHVIPALSISSLISIFLAIGIVVAGEPLNKIVPICGRTIDILGRRPLAMIIRINFIFDIICVLSYGMMLISFSFRKWKRNGGFSTLTECKKFQKQQKIIMPAAKMLSILYSITLIIPDLIFLLGSSHPNLIITAGQMRMTCAFVEFISLLSRCKKFRQELKKLCGLRGNERRKRITRIIDQLMRRTDGEWPIAHFGNQMEEAMGQEQCEQTSES